MTQEQLEEILPDIAEKLRNKFGIEPSINHQGSIIVEGAGNSNSPIIPEEITQLISEVIEAHGLNFNSTEWPFTVNNRNGNLVIRYTP